MIMKEIDYLFNDEWIGHLIDLLSSNKKVIKSNEFREHVLEALFYSIDKYVIENKLESEVEFRYAYMTVSGMLEAQKEKKYEE